jgi:hypothetical protein
LTKAVPKEEEREAGKWEIRESEVLIGICVVREQILDFRF